MRLCRQSCSGSFWQLTEIHKLPFLLTPCEECALEPTLVNYQVVSNITSDSCFQPLLFSKGRWCHSVPLLTLSNDSLLNLCHAIRPALPLLTFSLRYLCIARFIQGIYLGYIFCRTRSCVAHWHRGMIANQSFVMLSKSLSIWDYNSES